MYILWIRFKYENIPGLIHDVYAPDPDGEGPIHEGDNSLHLLEPQTPEVSPAQACHVIDDSQSSNLGLHL